ncbi:MAG: SPOR domain-containing protein, partial [Bacteroidales bacterium]|nr:SPOR domain-containing protein [Bacteroidales bacterium]
DFPYYIIIGSFSTRANAERFLASASPYPGTVLTAGRNLYVAALCPGMDLAEVYESYWKVRKEKFCPSNAWILIDSFQ